MLWYQSSDVSCYTYNRSCVAKFHCSMMFSGCSRIVPLAHNILSSAEMIGFLRVCKTQYTSPLHPSVPMVFSAAAFSAVLLHVCTSACEIKKDRPSPPKQDPDLVRALDASSKSAVPTIWLSFFAVADEYHSNCVVAAYEFVRVFTWVSMCKDTGIAWYSICIYNIIIVLSY